MTNETYEKLQTELSQLLNTEKYKQLKNKDKEIYKQAVLACKSVISHYKTNVEAEPIKHGRWKAWDLTWGRSIYVCTSCGDAMEVPTENGKPIFNYCPNCGARMMDEVEE